MIKICDTEKKSDESFRFRDPDIFTDSKDADGRPQEVVLKAHGTSRRYYEKTILVDGAAVAIRRPCEGPDAVSLAQFEHIASEAFDNIVRVCHGLPVLRDIFIR